MNETEDHETTRPRTADHSSAGSDNAASRCYLLGLEMGKLLQERPEKRPSSRRLKALMAANIFHARGLGVTIDLEEVLR